MHTVTKQMEITVHTPNEPASLGRLMAIVGCCGTEVLTACSYRDEAGTVTLLVTDNAPHATRDLEASGFRCKSAPIVLVQTPDKPGLAALLGAKLAEAGIGVLCSYWFHSEGKQSYVVFKTTDDDRAIYMLEVDALIHDFAAAQSWRQSEIESGRREAAVKQTA
jgi:hypothetical protein